MTLLPAYARYALYSTCPRNRQSSDVCPDLGIAFYGRGVIKFKSSMGYLHPETAQIKVVIDRLNQQKDVM